MPALKRRIRSLAVLVVLVLLTGATEIAERAQESAHAEAMATAASLNGWSLRTETVPDKPITRIVFTLQHDTGARIHVLDEAENLVETLVLGDFLPAGEHEIQYRPHLPSGTYDVVLVASNVALSDTLVVP